MTGISDDIPIEGNVAEFSVSEISQAVKRTLEGTFDHVRVRGEIGRPNYHGSGHLYFTLKDENAAIDGVCWRGTVGRLGLRLEEGMEVVCVGRVSSYPRSSKYQLVVESVELAGEGALLKLLEDRRKKLAAEGLFEIERKQPLPFLPDVIGVITSPTGAVIRDILHRLADRFPRHVLLWPVRVQGEDAAGEVAAAIEGFNLIEPGGKVPRPDLLIVARGGGSLEDLWAFNEEIVVRAAAASAIPLISAVGHETDTTLIDHASDMRAPTPTAAAEMAVPVRDDLLAQVIDDQRRMISAMARALTERATRVEGLGRGLPEPRRLLEVADQRLDTATGRLQYSWRNLIETRAAAIARLGAGLRDPGQLIAMKQQGLNQTGVRLLPAARRAIDDSGKRLDGLGKLLESLSYKKVLERGYAVVRDAKGVPVTRVAAAVPGGDVAIEFADGEIGATLRGDVPPGKPAAPRPKPRSDDPQGRLL